MMAERRPSQPKTSCDFAAKICSLQPALWIEFLKLHGDSCAQTILSFPPLYSIETVIFSFLSSGSFLRRISLSFHKTFLQLLDASFGCQRLATGSEIIEKLPFVEVDEEQIVSSTGALALSLGKVMPGTTLRVSIL